MKIVNRETFLKLPENTLFAKYEPCFFSNLCIKGKSWDVDFLYQGIVDSIKCNNSDEFSDKLEDAEKKGTSLEMDFECGSRDGLFDDNQLFAVFESKDVNKLLDKLKECI